jgi:hypothetical protein
MGDWSSGGVLKRCVRASERRLDGEIPMAIAGQRRGSARLRKYHRSWQTLKAVDP